MYEVKEQPGWSWQQPCYVLVRDGRYVYPMRFVHEYDAVATCESLNDAARLHNDRLAELDRQRSMRSE